MKQTSLWMLALVGIGIVTCVGCGHVSDRVAVEGQVLVDGKPLELGSIVFVPIEQGGGPKVAAEVREGRYELPAAEGPGIGPQRVEIRQSPPERLAWDDPLAFAAMPPASVDFHGLPAEYNRDSTLTATTTVEGDNEFNFSLQAVPDQQPQTNGSR